MRYILAVAAGDSSRAVRRHVARNACQSLALLVSMGELKNSAKESESLLIEEDGSAQDKTKETKKSEVDSLELARTRWFGSFSCPLPCKSSLSMELQLVAKLI